MPFLHKIFMIRSDYDRRFRPSLVLITASPWWIWFAIFLHHGARVNIPIQCQLPEISEVFERGTHLKIITLSFFLFVALCLRVGSIYGPSRAVSQSMVSHEGTKPRRGKANARFGETLVRLSERPFILEIGRAHV